MMIEPSNQERAELPETSSEYISDLESENKQQAEQITNLQDEAEQIAEDLEDADEVIMRLKSESGFGTLLAENRATIQQQAEQITALSNRHQCLSDVANGYVAEIKRLKDIIASIFGGQNNET